MLNWKGQNWSGSFYLPQQHMSWVCNAKTNRRRVFTSSILVLRAPRCESSAGCRVAGQMPPASRPSADRLSTRMLSPQRGKPVLLFPMAVAALGGPLDPSGGPTIGTLPASQWVRGQGEVVLASDPKFHRVYFLKVESEEEECVSQWRLWKCETIPHSPFFFIFYLSRSSFSYRRQKHGKDSACVIWKRGQKRLLRCL